MLICECIKAAVMHDLRTSEKLNMRKMLSCAWQPYKYRVCRNGPGMGLGRGNAGAGGFSGLRRKLVSELILQCSQSWALSFTWLPSLQHSVVALPRRVLPFLSRERPRCHELRDSHPQRCEDWFQCGWLSLPSLGANGATSQRPSDLCQGVSGKYPPPVDDSMSLGRASVTLAVLSSESWRVLEVLVLLLLFDASSGEDAPFFDLIGF